MEPKLVRDVSESSHLEKRERERERGNERGRERETERDRERERTLRDCACKELLMIRHVY